MLMNKYYLSVLALTGALTAGAVVPGTPVIVPNPQKAQSESLVPMRPMKSALEISALEIKGLTRSLEQPQTEFTATEASFYCLISPSRQALALLTPDSLYAEARVALSLPRVPRYIL